VKAEEGNKKNLLGGAQKIFGGKKGREVTQKFYGLRISPVLAMKGWSPPASSRFIRYASKVRYRARLKEVLREDAGKENPITTRRGRYSSDEEMTWGG